MAASNDSLTEYGVGGKITCINYMNHSLFSSDYIFLKSVMNAKLWEALLGRKI